MLETIRTIDDNVNVVETSDAPSVTYQRKSVSQRRYFSIMKKRTINKSEEMTLDISLIVIVLHVRTNTFN
jgi:hypothetical protein